MKMKTLFLMLLLACASIAFLSCGDEGPQAPAFSIETSGLTLNISSRLQNNSYSQAGIKIITSGYNITSGCTANANGYCIFSASDIVAGSIVLSGATGTISISICTDGVARVSCQTYENISVSGAIGQSALGGVIYYVYTDSAGVQHGLVAATADEPDAGSSGKYTWDALAVDPNSAQYACAHKRVTVGGVTYSGWILPNLAQMSALFDNRYAISPNQPNGGFVASESLFTNNYWTSIEADSGNPWCMSFGNGFMVDSSDATRQQSVRCIRTF